MNSETLAAFKRFAYEGSIVAVSTSTAQIIGSLVMLTEEGILLQPQNSQGFRFLHASIILDLFIGAPNESGQTESFEQPHFSKPAEIPLQEKDSTKECATPDLLSSPRNLPVKSQTQPPRNDRAKGHQPPGFIAEISKQNIDTLPSSTFERLTQQPNIVLPLLDFKIVHLDREDQQELARWKNKAAYAEKVRELDRITGFLPEMMRWTERVKDDRAFLLCGLLALKAGENLYAKDQFQRSHSLGNHSAALALSHLAIASQDWQTAATLIVRYCIDSNLPATEKNILALGCCLVRASNPEITGLASIRPDSTSNEAIELRNLVLAYTLASNYPAAARAALAGDIVLASHLAANSMAFSPPSLLEVPHLNILPAPDMSRLIKTDNGEKVEPVPIKLFGHINGVYPDKGYGFIADSTQKTYFFHFSDVDDYQLLEDLRGNRAGQRVSFITFHVRPDGAKYEAASRVQLTESTLSQVRLSPAAKPIHLPKDDQLYAEAKKAEHTGDLEKAQTLLSKVIERDKKYAHSAIKDLAQLLSRLERGDDALALLNHHREKFAETRSLDSQKAYILIRMRRYVDAAAVFEHLYSSASRRERNPLMRQQAYCLLMAGQIQEALNVLSTLLNQEPDDVQSLQMVEFIESIRNNDRPEHVELEELAGLWTGISPFAQSLINDCDFTGLDERSKARGFFTPKDFSEMERSFEKSRGRIPRHKAKLLLTLAAMAQRSPEAARKRNPRLYLGRALSFMGEAAIYDNTHPDTARCYLSEALNLVRGSDVDIRFPLTCLLSTYLRVKPALGDFIANDNFFIGKVLAELGKEPEGWQLFKHDLPYFYILSREAVQLLLEEIKANQQVLPRELIDRERLSQFGDVEIERMRTERAALSSRAKQAYSSYLHFHETARTLLEVRDTTCFDLDRQRLDSLANISNEAALYWQEQDYIEREARHARLTNGLETFEIELLNQPTKMSFELLLPLARQLRSVLHKNLEDYKDVTKPALSLSNILSNDYYLLKNDGSILLSLELASGKGGAPVEGLDILAHEDDGLKVIESGQSPELLRAGERRQVDITILPASNQLKDQAFTLRCFLTYRTRSGHQHRSQDFAIPVRIGDESHFISIPNPYKQYSGGRSVEDPQMFKGRGDLLSRILEVITLGPIGQCFVLYGQKRSGKTSVLKQLKRHLEPPCMPVEITLGILDVIDGETNFVQICLDRCFRYMRDGLGIDLDSSWPTRAEIRSEPLRAFTQGIDWTLRRLRERGWREPRIVLLIDEFTYIYDLIRDGIIHDSFMRNWKALLQMECFSAVVVGQDSMPRFKQAFQNEFGSTFDERISYLSFEEATRLAEEPILLESRSRYRGQAMNRLLQLTAGSPFYTHILCDRLVSHLNIRRAPFITEADIERVTRDLVSGGEALPIERFDPLISPDGSVTEVPRISYLNVLKAISARRGGALFADLPPLPSLSEILKDLQERDVIMIDAGRRYSIRIGLFSEWLQVNEDLSVGEN